MLARDEKLLRWQHPRGEDELSFVTARDAGELVGILGVIPVDVCVRGARVPGGWLTTWAVMPAARQRRVGLRLLQFVLERHDFVGTLGGNAATMGILGALRFDTRPSVPRWVRPLSLERCADLLGHEPDLTEPPASVRSSGVHAVRSWSPELATRWDRTWVERIAPALVGTWRDAAYLEWRYARHPRFEYRIRIAEDGDDAIAALLVHRVESVQGRAATVLRIVEAIGDPEAIASLGVDLIAEGRELGSAFADFYCTSPSFGVGLERIGFVQESGESPFPTRFQPLEPGARPLTAAMHLSSSAGAGDPFVGDDVYFTRSDCDQDRPS